MHQNTLFAVPFDLSRLAVTGTPQPVLEDVSNREGGAGSANFDFSQTGTLVYVGRHGESPWSVFWLDSAIQPLLSASGLFVMSPRFSPDGKRPAFAMDNGQGLLDVWVQYLERSATSRLTSLPGENGWPVWTPDGKNIIFRKDNRVASGPFLDPC